jgi:branched-chain amino acid transport system permease protein
MTELLQFTVTGIAVGLVYSLIALGFVMVWKSSGVANLAMGQMLLLFAWFAYSMLAQKGIPFWLAFILVLVFSLVVGWIIERVILRPLIAQPILSLITVTLGVAFVIQGLVSIIWPKGIAALPRLFPQNPIHIGSAVVSQEYLWAAVISLALFAALSFYFKYNRTGIVMRATADDQKAVQACGIAVTKIFSRAWMLASALAAIGGVLMASIGGITFGLVDTGMRAFSVVILGGLDSFFGAMVAGPIIGLAQMVGGGYLTPLTWPGVNDVIPFIIIIIVMFIKPYGLFGEERIERI